MRYFLLVLEAYSRESTASRGRTHAGLSVLQSHFSGLMYLSLHPLQVMIGLGKVKSRMNYNQGFVRFGERAPPPCLYIYTHPATPHPTITPAIIIHAATHSMISKLQFYSNLGESTLGVLLPW